MTRKSIVYFISSLLIISFCGVVIFKSSAADSQGGKLWNLQKLEEFAETGDVEAQLRLIDFYQRNINSRDHYKKKLEYWRQKAEVQKSSQEYSAAVIKLSDERHNYFKEQENLQKEMKDRMLQLKEKYEKLPPEAQKNEAMVWHDGLNAVFNTQKTYSWKLPFSLKYRLTINIDTPEGIKSGSTVQEVYFPPADSENIYNPYNQGIPRGEAAYIDLGKRGVVFAIMPDPANARNTFFGLIRAIFPTVPTVYDQSRYQEVLQHYNDLRGVKDEVPPDFHPMFVYFKDIDDPKTFELVYKRQQGSRKDTREVEVDRLAEIFGSGVKIKNMTLEMTDDPLEWKLDDKLKWIEGMEEKEITRMLKEEYNRKITSGEMLTHFITNGIAYYIFRQGQEDPLEKINTEKKIRKEIADRLSKATAYKDYSSIPWILSKNLRHLVTLDEYLERTNAEVKEVLDENIKHGQYKSVLELDMDQDDHITPSEVNELAMDAFVTIDKDKNGNLSYNEVEDFRRGIKQ